MQVHITVKGLEGAGKSDALKNYITDSFSKVAEFLEREEWQPLNVDLTVIASALHAKHEFELHIRGPHFKVLIKKEGTDLYKLITKVMDVALDDLHNHKRRALDKKKDGDGFHR
jgi:ribosome-associated translation inhibitor RaiA